jgi:creatinine amidohydrolase
MRTYLLIENNWKNLLTHRYDLAIMSWGATEAHNYHLPYGTDVYEADAISTESARKAYEKGGKVIVLPPYSLRCKYGPERHLFRYQPQP